MARAFNEKQARSQWPCVHRGKKVGEVICKVCPHKGQDMVVYACAHPEAGPKCTIRKSVMRGQTMTSCNGCKHIQEEIPKVEAVTAEPQPLVQAQKAEAKKKFAPPEGKNNFDRLKDKDWQKIRHARDRHKGFNVGRFVQSPPMLFTRDGHGVFIGDLYKGHAGFLVGGGPSLGRMDLSLLQRRGMVTMAMNNAVSMVRTHLWVSVDDPGHFVEQVWYDPGVMKFVPLDHADKKIWVRDDKGELVKSRDRVADCPAVFYYRRNETFQPEQWLHEDSFNWGVHSSQRDEMGNKGSRMVLYVAVRMMYHLGIRRLYLLGTDFKMDKNKPYAFQQKGWAGKVRGNRGHYRIANDRFAALKPFFDREGFEVYNCTPDSGFTVFPYVPYEEAVASASAMCPEKIVTAGHYELNDPNVK